jgi:hypothetical protein
MYTSIIENKEIMSLLKNDKENYETNCLILNSVKDIPYEKQLELARGLLLKDKLSKSELNKENYELNRKRRLEQQKKRDNEIGKCPYCKVSMKKGSIQKHKLSKKCIETYERINGECVLVKCNLCNLMIKDLLIDKHRNGVKCLERQEIFNEMKVFQNGK